MTCPYPGEDDPTVYVRRLAGISRYNCANGVSFDQLIPHTPRPSIKFVPSYVDLVEISNRSARPCGPEPTDNRVRLGQHVLFMLSG